MKYNPKQPSFHILICMIKVWKPKSPTSAVGDAPDDALMITEVENIEIDDSYKKLIGTASVKFPRGTVVKRTITEINKDKLEDDGNLQATLDPEGILMTTTATTKKAELSDFAVGNRIKIWLGYTTDPNIANSGKLASKKNIFTDTDLRNEYMKHLTVMFDGYINKCSYDTPIELKCENLASILKSINCPSVKAKHNMTVNDFLSPEGKYKMLSKTGLGLYPDTRNCEINIGKVSLTSDLTVADVLTEWAKYKVFAFIKYDNDSNPCIAVGRSYFSNAGKDSILKNSSKDIPEILFDYTVASNELQLMNVDKKWLAVEATGVDKQDKFYHITVRRNPQYKEEGKGVKKYQVLNETTISKKAKKLGATVLSKSKDKVDLSAYTVVPYMSKKMGITHDELLSEAIKYFESYNMNGIDGSLTLFGDLHLRTATKVKLTDHRHPQKNGYYFIDEVHTTFGSGGYRQNIKLPYCIQREQKSKLSDHLDYNAKTNSFKFKG